MTFLSNKKLRKYWNDRINTLLSELGAVPAYYPDCTIKHYQLITRASLLEIHPLREDSEFMSIMARFADVEKANEIFGNRGWHHNQYSGKWNYYASVGEGEKVKPCDRFEYIDMAVEEVKRRFEGVMIND